MRRVLIAVIMASLAACGPVVYINEVTRKASTAVEAARRADAERLAPYWYTRAVAYLDKARETAARADFQGANRFGRLATAAAVQAVADAGDPTKRPLASPKPRPATGAPRDLAPAKDAP